MEGVERAVDGGRGARAKKRGWKGGRKKKKAEGGSRVGAAEQGFFGLCSVLHAPGQNELLRCSAAPAPAPLRKPEFKCSVI